MSYLNLINCLIKLFVLFLYIFIEFLHYGFSYGFLLLRVKRLFVELQILVICLERQSVYILEYVVVQVAHQELSCRRTLVYQKLSILNLECVLK